MISEQVMPNDRPATLISAKLLFRSSLPVGEDKALQENPKFWEMIEAARSARA